MTAFECGWSSLTNGDLLSAAESKAFDVLITTDRNLKYQQNFTGRNIAILVLSSTNWPRIRPQVARVRWLHSKPVVLLKSKFYDE